MPINLANINTYFSESYTTFISNVDTIFLRNFSNSCSTVRINSITINHANATGSGITDHNYGGYCNINNPIPLSPNANVNIVMYDASAQLFANIFAFNNIPSNKANNIVLAATRNNPIVLDEGDYLISRANVSDMLVMTATYDRLSELPLSSYLSRIPIEYLVVAGGGGSGGTQSGVSFSAGGGGGQALEGSFQGSIGTTYTVVVGGGGAANQIGPTAIGNTGSASSITPGVSACGGGGGGVRGVGIGGNSGQTPFCGGTMVNANAGGGGGAGGNGSPAPSPTTAGAGGNGVLSYITGTSTGTRYAGGGGGGGNPNGGLGTDGGGRGLSYLSVPGTAGNVNSGGGGGGDGGGGGSGIVVLRHPTDYRTANTTGSVTITSNLCYIIYQFSGSGSITF